MRKSQLINWSLMAGAAAIGAALIARQFRQRYSVTGKVILITGGSRGLGLVLARHLGRLGARIVICASHADQLQRATMDLRAKGIQALAFVCDVTDRSTVQSMAAQIRAHFGRIDVVINNAGVIQMGPYDSLTDADFDNALKTHVWGPLNVMSEVIPEMRARGSGRIVNIASIGGKLPIPHLIPYCASKFALVGLSQGYAVELAKDGIVVTTVCPGLMRTGSHHNAQFKGQHRNEFTWFSLAGSMPFLSVDADYAARQIINGLQNGSAEVCFGPATRIVAVAHELAPEYAIWMLSQANRLLPLNGGIGRRIARGAESHSALAPSLLTTLSETAAARNNELDS